MARIILDSNVILADPHLKGSAFRLLIEELKFSGDQLAIPSVVLDEAVNKISEELAKSVAAAKKSLAQVTKWLGQPTVTPEVDLDVFRADYRQFLVSKLGDAGALFLPYPDTAHSELVKRDLLRRKPFSLTGTGYRDALIWDTVIQSLVGDDQSVSFISANTSDFASNENLHEHLVQDLVALNINLERLTYFASLQKFVDAQIKPRLDHVQESLASLKRGEYPLGLEEAIVSRVQDTYAGRRWEPEEIGASREYRSISIRSVDSIYDIEVDTVQRLTAEEIVVELEAVLDVAFHVTVNLPDPDDDETLDIRNWEWPSPSRPREETFNMRVSVELTYDIELESITSMSLTGFVPA